jgi:hypothetical protein
VIAVTKSVTDTDAIVLSPYGELATPRDLPRVHDQFQRIVFGLQEGRQFSDTAARLYLYAGPTDAKAPFVATPLLRDGKGLPEWLPAEWRGMVTPESAAAFARAIPSHIRGEATPGRWGLHGDVEVTSATPEALSLLWGVRLPAIDPMHDVAEYDTPKSYPALITYPEPFDDLFTPWESGDAYFGQALGLANDVG